LRPVSPHKQIFPLKATHPWRANLQRPGRRARITSIASLSLSNFSSPNGFHQASRIDTQRTVDFLKCYARMEQRLLAFMPGVRGIGNLLKTAREQGIKIVNDNHDVLFTMANLRNRIVHGNVTGVFPWTPSESELQKYEAIVDEMWQPRRIRDVFHKFPTIRKGQDSLSRVLPRFNQFFNVPFRTADKALALLTMRTLLNWAKDTGQRQILDLDQATIEEALQYGIPDVWTVLRHDDLLSTARERFHDRGKRGKDVLWACILPNPKNLPFPIPFHRPFFRALRDTPIIYFSPLIYPVQRCL